jgi:hypothetical protein
MNRMFKCIMLPVCLLLCACDGEDPSHYKVLNRKTSGEYDYKIGDIVTYNACPSGKAKIKRLDRFDSSGGAHKIDGVCEDE